MGMEILLEQCHPVFWRLKQPKKLENQQQIQPKEKKREIIEIRADINEIEKEICSRENYQDQQS